MVSFVKVTDLDDVTELLWADGVQALLLAGGTDLLVRENSMEGRKLLVDISSLPAILGIGLDENGFVRIGAGQTHQSIADNPLIQRRARVLSLACSAVGSLQIRNRGTIGGNLGNASPAGDSLPALACLDAHVHLVSKNRNRKVPIQEFFLGPGSTSRAPDELIESVRFLPRNGRTVAFFKKAGQRLGMCCSKATVAFVARRYGDGTLSQVKIALGAVAPTVIRVSEAEKILEGKSLTTSLIGDAARACREAALPIDDIRSTAKYRKNVVGALLTEGLLEIFDHLRVLQQKSRMNRARRKRMTSRIAR